MLFERTYGVDLGNSSVKVYSFLKTKAILKKYDRFKRKEYYSSRKRGL